MTWVIWPWKQKNGEGIPNGESRGSSIEKERGGTNNIKVV